MDKIIRVNPKTYEKLYILLTKKRFEKFAKEDYSNTSFDEIITDLLTQNAKGEI